MKRPINLAEFRKLKADLMTGTKSDTFVVMQLITIIDHLTDLVLEHEEKIKTMSEHLDTAHENIEYLIEETGL